MNFIKNCFKRVVGWIAYPFAKMMDKAAELMGPVMARFKTEHKIILGWKEIAKAIGGVLLCFVIPTLFALLVVGSIGALTWALSLVMPILFANAIAVLASLALCWYVIASIESQRVDEIAVEVEIEV